MGAHGGLAWFKFREPVIPCSGRAQRFKDLTSWLGVAQNFRWPDGCVHTQEEDAWPQPADEYWVGSYGTNEDQFQLTSLSYFLYQLSWFASQHPDWTLGDLHEDLLTDPSIYTFCPYANVSVERGMELEGLLYPFVKCEFQFPYNTWLMKNMNEPHLQWSKVSSMLIIEWLQEMDGFIVNNDFAHQEEIWT